MKRNNKIKNELKRREYIIVFLTKNNKAKYKIKNRKMKVKNSKKLKNQKSKNEK